MVLAMEGGTVMQKFRNLKTLQGMGSKHVFDVKVKRNGQWVVLSSELLVPGDVMLLPASSQAVHVPCDCLILEGSAVVNEASLTGESVPQMKEGVETEDRPLDISGRDRVHCLFSGTQLIQSTPAEGCLCYVLRTGVMSAQGELIQMVEFSQAEVRTDRKDTLKLILLLLCFALAAVAYVIYQKLSGTGTEKLTKMNEYKLMLRCVMIITSVVPPELPMQMALAVNTALMALHKKGVMCTEPHRVPMAGTVQTCLFDKTGTLTTEQLVCRGAVTEFSKSGKCKLKLLSDCSSLEMKLVIAGCHSLVDLESGGVVGDPVELAAINAINWVYDGKNQSSGPSGHSNQLKILTRHHFSSVLQRMSTICKYNPTGKTIVVVKGSPEVVANLLVSVPEGYHETYSTLAHEGYRVLAMAFR
jgi:cation-transporting ATPase 13A1